MLKEDQKMRHYLYIPSMLLLTFLILGGLSCSKEETPTTPNFEEYGISSHIWDYNYVVWFDLDYTAQSKNMVAADIWMTAKGNASDASLKIGTTDIVFNTIESYTDGKIYRGATINLSTDQPISYKITNLANNKTYTGSINFLPKNIVVDPWPSFSQDYNYSPLWSIAENPDFNVIDAGWEGSSQHCEYIRQIDGHINTYTLVKTEWQNQTPIENFYFGINAIGYQRKHDNKVLIVGVSNNYYWWNANGKGQNEWQAHRSPLKFMDLIQEDINSK